MNGPVVALRRITVSNELRVLVVDDHPINRLVFTEIFTSLGCAVSVAETGAQALSVSTVDHFDLICLDRHMPGLSGDEVAKRLPDEQFVLAWSTDVSGLPPCFNGVLAKPISLAAAAGAMNRAVAWRTCGAGGGYPVDPRIAA
jgi:CheY-like chemotaxis protein